MMRAWIGVALLAGSWLLGLSYFELANPPAWVFVATAGVLLLAASAGSEDRREAFPTATQALASIVLLLPVAWFAPWPYRLAPVLIIAGLVPALPPAGARRLKSLGTGIVTAGVVLLAQSVTLRLYAVATSRNHDMPWPVPELLAGLAGLLGIDAAADGPLVVLGTMRQPQRLAVTWELVFDPVTACFLVGGLAMLAAWALGRAPAGRQGSAWLGAAWRLALIVLGWLPFRAALVVAIYLHRAARSDPAIPLNAMDQFLSPWFHLALVTAPALMAWRWITPVFDKCSPHTPCADSRHTDLEAEEAAKPQAAGRAWLLPAACLLGAALLAMGLLIDPVGTRKEGRVMFVERHAPWEPTDRPYDTAHFGGTDDDSVSYTYTLAYNYLGQFFHMSRLGEQDKIDDATLARCDVLVVKVPAVRYSGEEVDAVVRFVRSGGGLLLIGDHTNLDRSSAAMNDISRYFGFTFRDDVLYSTEPSPDDEHYAAARVPHPAVQYVPWFDFTVSCSVDPGTSRGRTVIEGTRLWSMPPEYHNLNYMPQARYCPEMRCGAFVQAWAARYGKGRALAWADSTLFSSFCIFQPGKAETLLGLVEWLNHEGPAVDPGWLLLALGMGVLAGGAWLTWPRRFEWLLLVAAGACGWVAGSEAVVALHRWAMPLPVAQRPLTRVVVDRTASQTPLATGAYDDDKLGRGYALLEQWIPRLGYATVRAAGADALTGDALVVICPSLPVDQRFRDRLDRYVSDGGKLLVIESGREDPTSTANDLLQPFGLSLDHEHSWQGELDLAEHWPAVQIDYAWEVVGGQRVASLGGERTIAATVRHGKGLVMAVGFGDLFADGNMGGEWGHYPNATERVRYQALFALLRSLVEDKPIVAPAAEPARPKPPSRPIGRLPGKRIGPPHVTTGGTP